MPVDANRHYRPGTLDEGVWACPSCGADNAGPIAQGCTSCGAGKPGLRAAAGHAVAPAPPGAREGAPRGGGRWARAHPQPNAAEAYDAGYEAGVSAARAATKLQLH